MARAFNRQGVKAPALAMHAFAVMPVPEMHIDRRSLVGGLALLPVACRQGASGDGSVTEQIPASVPAPGGLVELIKVAPSIRLDLRYATTNNFTGKQLYSQPRGFLQGVAAAALLRAHQRAQADGFGLTIFDAYRPWRVTRQLWDATPPAKRDYVANPKQGSRHNRGCAVDLTLHEMATDGLLQMPSAFDDFSKRAHRDFMDAPPDQIANRERLESYMEAEGFIGMSNEWWHFDFKDWRKFPVLDLAFEQL